MKTLKCENCLTEFSVKALNPGVPQKYCSATCRNKAASNRAEERFADKIKKEYAPTHKIESTFKQVPFDSNYYSKPNNNYQTEPDNSINGNPYSIKDIIETKIENVRLQIELRNRTEQLSTANGKLTNSEDLLPEKPTYLQNVIGKVLENPTAIISGIFLVIDGIKERTARKKATA